MVKILYLLYRSLTNFKHTLLVAVFGYTSYCHHSPTCSEYMLHRIVKDGTIRGLGKGFKRLLTCW
ncbi:membrane protein insertion efficiency factor YidD [Patescibacteria group bacterium]|nr:membrane protein insertion efficiency factor YidD [Patescibacteria group bacterium]MBU1966671.1 membrane protein insertion efficiency factor YidD [Patescibacteria group bacterium]MBU2543351.1 membrane protein insertion efficiency factor YidD [Patescibacteria group bacterium]